MTAASVAVPLTCLDVTCESFGILRAKNMGCYGRDLELYDVKGNQQRNPMSDAAGGKSAAFGGKSSGRHWSLPSGLSSAARRIACCFSMIL